MREYAVKKDIADELDGFVEQLSGLQLLMDGMPNDDFISTALQYTKKEDKSRHAIEDDVCKWAFKNGFLWSLFMELTYKCNCRCIHCYNPAFRGVQEISFEKATLTFSSTVI